jgi:hypothetical protein
MRGYEYPLTGHALVNATHSGNLNQVKKIIESGVDVNDYTGNTVPALTCACCNGNVEMVQYLLSQGANPNNYTETRISALKSVANSSSPDSFTIVKLLLDAGADANYEKDGNVALTLACDVSNDIDLIRLLLHVTDEKYYQKAYEYSQTEEIRNLFKEVCSVKAPNMILMNSANGFGGPQYKMKVHYDTPPADPLLRQVCEILDQYIDKFVKDPNKAIMYVFERMAIIDNGEENYENGKLRLSRDVRNAVGTVLRTYPLEQVEKTYWDLYYLLNNYVEEEYVSSSDSE